MHRRHEYVALNISMIGLHHSQEYTPMTHCYFYVVVTPSVGASREYLKALLACAGVTWFNFIEANGTDVAFYL
jgi:hypothetical protein